jgi:hypothetical protein
MSDKFIILGLKTRRASIAAEIDELDEKRRQLLKNLRSLDHTLKLMGFKGNPESIKSKRKYRSMFRRGELRRLIYNAERVHGSDATHKNVAAFIVRKMKWKNDSELLRVVTIKVSQARRDIRRRLKLPERHAANTPSSSGSPAQPSGCE